MSQKKKVIVITGPTASGKTSLSIKLAANLNTEIISADSMQVYKYMNIGTAKPTRLQMKGIKHHLIDIVDPDDSYNVARFKEDADNAIKIIHDKGRIPVICGGTGLYIDSLVKNIDFFDEDNDDTIREELFRIAELKGKSYLYSLLEKEDGEQAAGIHPNNVKRVVRALEVVRKTGMKISQRNICSISRESPYDFLIVGLNMNRNTLYKRIETRIDKMFADGLADEVYSLIKRGYDPCLNSMQGLGYKEIVAYLYGKATINECSNLLKRNTRRFAKRQLTWFRRNESIKWYFCDEYFNENDLFENVVANLGIF